VVVPKHPRIVKVENLVKAYLLLDISKLVTEYLAYYEYEFITCPICLEETNTFVMNTNAQMYCEQCLLQWNKENTFRDPLTNLTCLYPGIYEKFSAITNESDLLTRAQKVEEQKAFYMKSTNGNSPLSPLLQERDQSPPIGLNTVEYSELVFALITNQKGFYSPSDLPIKYLIKRKDDTGFGFEQLNLNGNSRVVTDIDIKGLYGSEKIKGFRGSNLSNIIFKNCTFGRWNFSYCNLNGCVFIDCTFHGEQTIFYKATGEPAFINCIVEDYKSWKRYSGDIRDLLRNRGLKSCQLRPSYLANISS
jgi:hypothetical protein